MSNLVDELVRYGSGCIKTFGKEDGKKYIDKCIALWSEKYGIHVAMECKMKLTKVINQSE